jgi:hypothetical protein
MRSKRSTVLVIAIRNRLVAELFIGGAGDETSRLVRNFAEARRDRVRGQREVLYLPHWKISAAQAFADSVLREGRALALIGHSWGADTVLRTAGSLDGQALIIGADPVAKPITRITARDGRPASAALVVHVDAAPAAYDRSDYVKAAGVLTGGGLPRAFRGADVRIETRLNHWNFRGMMEARDGDGQSAEDWLDAYPERFSRNTG